MDANKQRTTNTMTKRNYKDTIASIIYHTVKTLKYLITLTLKAIWSILKPILIIIILIIIGATAYHYWA